MIPQVSVLMPVYNGAAMLPACLESILSQTFADFELVVVDDGSTDGSGELLERMARKDARVALVRMGHEGIVAALNRGLAECRGAFICRMDCDDLMRPRRLALQLEHMRKNPGCDLVGTFVAPYGIGKEISPGAIAYHDWLNSIATGPEIEEAFFVDSPIAHSTFFGKRELFEALAGYRACEWAEDYDFLFRAQARGAAFAKVPQVLLERGDWEGRVTRVDSRCTRKAMFHAKAHYFARGAWLQEGREVVVAGTGPSGRVVAAALGKNGAPIRAFMDNRRGPPGRTVMGIPAHGFPGRISRNFLAEHRDAFFALCIREEKSRNRIVAQFEAADLSPMRDFVRFI